MPHKISVTETLLAQFSTLYLNSLSKRSLAEHSSEEWTQFLQERFAFFSEFALAPEGQFRLLPPDPTYPRLLNKRVLEYVCPDATFLLLTIERLFRDLGLQITRTLHPIMTLEVNADGQLVGLSKPLPGTQLVAVMYIEFEDTHDEAILSVLETRLRYHLQAIQSAYQDQAPMLALLQKCKADILSQDFSIHEPKEEWVNLLDWLLDQNFSFMGVIAYDLPASESSSVICDTNTGLGLLSSSFLSQFPALSATVLAHTDRMRTYHQPFVFSRLNFTSPIQRFEKFMRLSLKFPGKNGGLREIIFIGLLRQSSLFAKNIETPLIHLKMKSIFKLKNMLPGSYDYNEVIRIFTSIPKFELFRRTKEDLLQMVEDILSINNPNDIYCFSRKKLGIKLPIMIVIPPRLYTSSTVTTIETYLKKVIPHTDVEILDIPGEEHSRLQFYFEQSSDMSETVDCALLESELRELIKPWEDLFREAILAEYPGIAGEKLYHRYVSAFPNHYRVRCNPKHAVVDLVFLEKLYKENDIQFGLVPFFMPGSVSSGKTSLLTIYNKEKIELILIMPILENLGFRVFDELTTRIGTAENVIAYLHSFRFTDLAGNKIDEDKHRVILTDLLRAVFDKRAVNDRLNLLALNADLSWRAITVLQCYRNFLFQITAPTYTRDKITSTLLNHPASARLLFQYFETKFSTDPRLGDPAHRQKALLPKLEKQFLESLHEVSEVAEDLIFRRLLNAMQSTLRTNFYIPKSNGDDFVSIKIDSSQIQQMPLPVPYREIYVYDAGVEGCHIRFGSVARGGLRWSNRPDDFRKEVLDLVKTQQTKNVVIVPVGSKGGFIVKNQPTERQALQEETQRQYKKFVSALLDITDNFDVSGQVKSPEHVVLYDKADPYLVVAADKGTATFSDFANSVSEAYHFWLGDAFASGGTYGYNHKAVGVTAKGAWECVKLHFRELGKDCQTEPFTVAGIGDMAGDVFGNGMLLSPVIKLVAAFNHMHIFLDPNPPIESSLKERERLFNLPTSSWEDYDAKLISKGGGIFSRKAKEITLSPEIKALLNVDADVLTGEALITAILGMQVDLLWFGGIGTYIKASHQDHLSVGDPANDAVRIDSTQCRARVIGEGANLGITQAARIELNQRGVSTNTDAIDNSAGVNMSDYEVNIKILLNRLVREGLIASVEDRNHILTEMTDSVTAHCLINNNQQHRLISLDVLRSQSRLDLFVSLVASLTSSGLLSPKTEAIPEAAALSAALTPQGTIPRCILAVLQAYVKMSVYDGLVHSPVLDTPYFEPFYTTYFPTELLTKFPEPLKTHQLKKEILCTAVTNKVVNQCGITFYHDMVRLTDRTMGDITLAYLLLSDALNTDGLRKDILSSATSEADQYKALLLLEDALLALTQDLLQVSMIPLTVAFSKTLGASFVAIKRRLADDSRVIVAREQWLALGFDRDLSDVLAVLARPVVLIDLLYLGQA